MILTQTSSNWLIALFQHQWRWQDFSSYPTLMSLSGTWSQYFNFKWYHLLPNVYLISVLLIPVNIVNKKQNLIDNQKSTQNNWKQSVLWTCLNLIDLYSLLSGTCGELFVSAHQESREGPGHLLRPWAQWWRDWQVIRGWSAPEAGSFPLLTCIIGHSL